MPHSALAIKDLGQLHEQWKKRRCWEIDADLVGSVGRRKAQLDNIVDISLSEEVERPLVCCCLCVEEAIGRCDKALSNRGRGSRLHGSGCEQWQRTMQRQGRKKGARCSGRLPAGRSGAGD
ncbi:hypothetical protein BHE74_00037550 [Ensete ventricosum]|nr:hypothetical protein BHE74_00037550 [Ensete ventricosum]